MSNLELYLLGPPRIKLAGRSLEIQRRKVLAILAYLAVNGEAQRRDMLASLFWPDAGQSRARAALTRHLSELKKALGGAWLAADREMVGLQLTADLWLDVDQFEQYLADCPEATPDYLTSLTEAVDLYRDDFLTGFTLPDCPEFDEWQFFQAEGLRQKLIAALERLVGGHMAQGQFELALHQARRWLALNPLHEPAHRQLMQLYVHTGQQAAALRQYQLCRQTLEEELGVAPAPETTALYTRIRSGDLSKSVAVQQNRGEDKVSPPARPPSPISIDWGEAVEAGIFYGRQAELAQLERRLVSDRRRLMAILGMGGVGKTVLATKLVQIFADQPDRGHFEHIIWRSLLNAPPLTDILQTWLQCLPGQRETELPASLDEQLTLLFHDLSQHRCLLILDNFESIMQEDERGGYYRPGYEDYGQLIQRFGGSKHQSCLLITSRERPKGFAHLEEDIPWVKSLQLTGLQAEAGQEILKRWGLFSPGETTTALVERYSGNPLALKLVSQTIRDLFGGDVATFLAEETLIFDDIRDVLEQQFARLTALEQAIMIWLAIERKAVASQTLWDNLVYPESRRAFLEALRSLQRRSLLEKRNVGPKVTFTLQNVVIEYVTDYFVEAVCREIETERLNHLTHHALLKAQAKDYVRESQARLILQPIAERLVAKLGQVGLEEILKRLLATLQADASLQPGYAGGNILNLLLHLGVDLRGADLSQLVIWQAYLRGFALAGINFTGADLTGSVFTDSFSEIWGVVFSPDGQLLAAGTANGEIHLWQTANGQLYDVFKSDIARIWSVVFSPEGHILAGGTANQTVCLWDARTGQVRHTLRGHTQMIRSVVFSPNGQTLASCSADQTVRLWDVSTGRNLQVLRGHSDGVSSLAFSPDGEILASSSWDHTVRLWRVSTGDTLAVLRGHRQGVAAVAFSPDGEFLASCSRDQTICLWQMSTHQVRHTLRGHTNEVATIAFSPDGRTIASGGVDQTLRLWQTDTGQTLHTLRGHTSWVASVAFSPDGETFVSCGGDQTVRLWQTETGQALYTLHAYIDRVYAVAFAPHREILASASDQGIRLWQTDSGQIHRALPGHKYGVQAVAFSADGTMLAAGGSDQLVRLWQTNMGQPLHTLRGHTQTVASVAFSPDGRILASSSNDQTVRLWQTNTGQALHTLSGHTRTVASVAFSPNEHILASGSWDQTVRLWDIHTGQTLQILQGHTSGVHCVTFNPNGQIVASCGTDRTVRLWQTRTGQVHHILAGHTLGVLGVAFSPDGKILASAGEDHTVRLWQTDTGQMVHTLQGHTSVVVSVAFSPDGKTLFSGSWDETIKLWDIPSGQCLQTLRADGPYAGMNISGVKGLTVAQKEALKTLGAVEDTAG